MDEKFLADLAAGLARSTGSVIVAQPHLPGGGSEHLRWAGRMRMIERTIEEERRAQMERERRYNPYGGDAT